MGKSSKKSRRQSTTPEAQRAPDVTTPPASASPLPPPPPHVAAIMGVLQLLHTLCSLSLELEGACDRMQLHAGGIKQLTCVDSCMAHL